MPDTEKIPSSSLFATPPKFVTSVVQPEQVPAADRPEIAFAGRSNVGKSTLINALTRQRNLARTSKTPGRTRQLNYYDLSGRLWLVDLPGFGYARVSQRERKSWQSLLEAYMRGRPNLMRVLLLVDARRGVGPLDEQFMAKLDSAALPWQIILTKIDALKASEREAVLLAATEATRAHPAAHPVPLSVSALKKQGLDEIRHEIDALVASQTRPA